MPIPWTCRKATREWQAFIAIARERMDLDSGNTTHTAVQGVSLAFKRRLTPQQAVDFAQVLPAVMRGAVCGGLEAGGPHATGHPAGLDHRGQALRPHHNLTPDTCVAAMAHAIAHALRRSVLRADLKAVLADLPGFARRLRCAGSGHRDLGSGHRLTRLAP